MTQRIQIDEIVEESIQGRSGGVFRCIGDDGESYFLKGLGVGRPDLAKELICANLARAFGLPVAGFALADVCITMCESFSQDWQRRIGLPPEKLKTYSGLSQEPCLRLYLNR